MDPSAIQGPLPDYCCLKFMVALHITATQRKDALFYAEALHQALSNFHFLESLHLASRGAGCDGAAEIAVTDKQSQSLRKLELRGIPCSSLDLCCATRLIYLNLWLDEHSCAQPSFVLNLPTSLKFCL